MSAPIDPPWAGREPLPPAPPLPEPVRVLFLDMDGVLNGHADYGVLCGALIRHDCVVRLQLVLDVTDAAIVVSSAWRYQVLRGAVTLAGFEHMLRSHGLRARVIGVTGTDAGDTGATGQSERVGQIRAWLAKHPEVTRWAVVDDAKLSLADPSLPIVETDGARGLVDSDADKLIALLRGWARPVADGTTQ